MTRFALGAKCGKPGSPPCTIGAGWFSARASPLSNPARAAMPTPAAPRPKKCRRVMEIKRSRCASIALLLRDGRVEVQDQTRGSRVGRQFARLDMPISRRFAVIQKLHRRLGRRSITLFEIVQNRKQNLLLGRPGGPGQDQAVSEVDALGGSRAAFAPQP